MFNVPMKPRRLAGPAKTANKSRNDKEQAKRLNSITAMNIKANSQIILDLLFAHCYI